MSVDTGKDGMLVLAWTLGLAITLICLFTALHFSDALQTCEDRLAHRERAMQRGD